jgi:hypothetical protein
MGTSRIEDFQSLANSEAGTYRDANTSPSATRVNQSFQSGKGGLAPIVETPNIGFGANDFAMRHMMNKTGPNFLKSTRNIGLDESLESEL